MDSLFESRVNRFKGTLLVPNSGIQRDLARSLTMTMNNMASAMKQNVYAPEYSFNDIEIDMQNTFKEQATGIANAYMTQQQAYSDLVVNRIVEQIYGQTRYTPSTPLIDQQEKENTINIFMLLPLFFLNELRLKMKKHNIERLDIDEYHEVVNKVLAKTNSRIGNIVDKVNFTDFMEKTQNSLIGVGITKAIWVARDMGQHKRPSHHNILNGQVYDLRDGIYDPDADMMIQCGQLNGCRCIPKIVSNLA